MIATAANVSSTPQIIVIEGLDGVGKSTIANTIVEFTAGVDVTKVIGASMADSRQVIMRSDSADARLHYWLAVNYMAGEYAEECTHLGRTAIIDSYFFRTIASHKVLNIEVDWNAILLKAVRPDRAVLLTVPEQIRRARLESRNDSIFEPGWHAELDRRWRQVLDIYRDFGLLEVDNLSTPEHVASQILANSSAMRFRFAGPEI